MKQLLIIGARGHGREVYNLAHNCIGYGTDFIIKGFLDDKSDALDNFPGYAPILDSVEHYQIQKDDVFICALGDVKYKKKYAEIILAKGGEFINLIHETASISRNAILGKGCIVSRYVAIGCDVRIGDFATFLVFTVVGHDARIGNFCQLDTYSFMGGFSEIGNMVTIHTKGVILPKVIVEDNVTIGASSVVIKRVKAGITVYGNPAKKLEY